MDPFSFSCYASLSTLFYYSFSLSLSVTHTLSLSFSYCVSIYIDLSIHNMLSLSLSPSPFSRCPFIYILVYSVQHTNIAIHISRHIFSFFSILFHSSSPFCLFICLLTSFLSLWLQRSSLYEIRTLSVPIFITWPETFAFSSRNGDSNVKAT